MSEQKAVVMLSLAVFVLQGCGRISSSYYRHDGRNTLLIEESEHIWPFGHDGRRLVLEQGGVAKASVELPSEGNLPRFNIYSSGSSVVFVHPTGAYTADLASGTLLEVPGSGGAPPNAVYLGCIKKAGQSPVIMFHAADLCAENETEAK